MPTKRPLSRFPSSLDAAQATRADLQAGDLVRHTAEFLRAIGWCLDVPADGIVLSVREFTRAGILVNVQWCTGRSATLNAANLEYIGPAPEYLLAELGITDYPECPDCGGRLYCVGGSHLRLTVNGLDADMDSIRCDDPDCDGGLEVVRSPKALSGCLFTQEGARFPNDA